MRGVWHHQGRRRRGPRELTGIVDHSRGGSPHGAGSLPGTERTPSTINSKTPPASWMPSISSSLLAMLQVRCAARVQQDTTGHRARTGDPLYQIRLLLRASRHRLTPRQQERLREAFTADEAHVSVDVAYLHRASVRGLPPSHTHPRPTPGRTPHRAPTSLSHPLNRSPRGEPYASGRTHSTPTSIPVEPATAPRKPSTDIIELGRRIARGYRNPTSYQLRMLRIAGGLDVSTHTQL